MLNNFNNTDQEQYVASIADLSEVEKNFLKAKNCILSVSIGNISYEDQKLISILQMINRHFKECTIVVGDTLKRYTMAILAKSDNHEEYYDKAKELGDNWLRYNTDILKKHLKIPYIIKRWDYWLRNSAFEENLAKVENLFLNNKDHITAVNQDIDKLQERLKKRYSDLDDQQIRSGSIKYLLEECACFLQWFDLKYDYEVYPARRLKCIQVTLDILQPEKSKEILKIARIRFDKKHNLPSVKFEKVTIDHILKVLPGHIYWKDKFGVYRGCNLQQAKFYGLNNINEVIGKSDFDILDYDAAFKLRANDIKVAKSNMTQVLEESAYVGENKVTFISYKTALVDEHGDVLGVLGVSLDITKQKEAEEKLLELNLNLTKTLDDLRNALYAKKAFLSNVSHEIRTPLSCILKISQLLYDDWEKYPNNESRKAHLKMALDANIRLESVLANLLDLSRFQSGAMQYKMDHYCLKQSTQDVIGEFIDSKYRINFNFDVKANLSLVYDHFRVEQVIRNLLANALKYAQSGMIDINLFAEDGFACFVISDQGIGIPENELEDIFKIFVQSSITESFGGTGSGLAISRLIIQDHGGSIWAQNNSNGIGCSFIFKLPINNIKIDNTNSNEFATVEKALLHEKEIKPLLLLIDDNLSILQISKLILQKIGFDVVTVNSGRDGINYLRNNQNISVVLLDLMMPDYNGIRVLEIVKNDPSIKDIPIYIYSGIGIQDEIDKAISLGAHGFIDKTCNSNEIAKILSSFLNKMQYQT